MDAITAAQSQSMGFYIVFVGAIVAFVALSVVVIVTVIKKDKDARQRWLASRSGEQGKGGDVTA